MPRRGQRGSNLPHWRPRRPGERHAKASSTSEPCDVELSPAAVKPSRGLQNESELVQPRDDSAPRKPLKLTSPPETSPPHKVSKVSQFDEEWDPNVDFGSDKASDEGGDKFADESAHLDSEQQSASDEPGSEHSCDGSAPAAAAAGAGDVAAVPPAAWSQASSAAAAPPANSGRALPRSDQDVVEAFARKVGRRSLDDFLSRYPIEAHAVLKRMIDHQHKYSAELYKLRRQLLAKHGEELYEKSHNDSEKLHKRTAWDCKGLAQSSKGGGRLIGDVCLRK